MLASRIVIAAATQQAANEGSSYLGDAMGGSLMQELLVPDKSAMFVRKFNRNITTRPASIVQPFGQCTFDGTNVAKAAKEHGLQFFFCSGAKGDRVSFVNKLSDVPYLLNSDLLTFVFDAWSSDQQELEKEGGALACFTKRVEFAFKETSIPSSHDLIAVIRHMGGDYAKRFSITVGMLVDQDARIWPELICNLWQKSEMYPRVMHFQWMSSERQVPCLFIE